MDALTGQEVKDHWLTDVDESGYVDPSAVRV